MATRTGGRDCACTDSPRLVEMSETRATLAPRESLASGRGGTQVALPFVRTFGLPAPVISFPDDGVRALDPPAALRGRATSCAPSLAFGGRPGAGAARSALRGVVNRAGVRFATTQRSRARRRFADRVRTLVRRPGALGAAARAAGNGSLARVRISRCRGGVLEHLDRALGDSRISSAAQAAGCAAARARLQAWQRDPSPTCRGGATIRGSSQSAKCR